MECLKFVKKKLCGTAWARNQIYLECSSVDFEATSHLQDIDKF